MNKYWVCGYKAYHPERGFCVKAQNPNEAKIRAKAWLQSQRNEMETLPFEQWKVKEYG